jgi:hypothetical protein
VNALNPSVGSKIIQDGQTHEQDDSITSVHGVRTQNTMT